MAAPCGFSLYKPEHCQEAVKWLAEGFSLTALAGKLGVTRQTVDNWKKQYPEFAEALEIGRCQAVLWWEERQRHLAKTGEGNATACVFGLKNRAREDWQDVNRNEHSGPDGAPIPHSLTVEFVRPGDSTDGTAES